MSDQVVINDGAVGPPEKPVYNPKQEVLSKELIIEKAKKLGEKLVYIFGVGMKRIVVVQKRDGKELVRLPLPVAILFVVLSQFLLLPAAAVLVVYFKWKIILENKNLPPITPPSSSVPPPYVPPPSASSTNSSGYSEPTLPPMPT